MAARLFSQPRPLSLALCLGLLVLLGFSGRAAAGKVLVLGFVEDGKPNSRVRQSVIQFLSRMGEEVVGASLPNTDQLCTQTDCMLRLGEHYAAQRLVGGELIRNDTSYRILIWLFDRITEQPNSAEAQCTDCSPELLSETVARTTGHVLEIGPTPLPPAPPPSAPMARTAPAPVPPASCAGYRTFGRGLAIGSLAALTTGGLIAGSVLSAYDGQVYLEGHDMQPERRYNFTSHYQLMYSLTAVSALGLAAAAMPWQSMAGRDSRCTNTPTGRKSFGRGIAIGALGSFAVMGLVSAIALTGVNGTQYDTTVDGTPVLYDLRPHYTGASVVSAGMIVGLGLAIFLR